MSKVRKWSEKTAGAVTGGYKKIENGVVSGYQKIEHGAVSGFTKVCDWFVAHLFIRDGETVEQAKTRLSGKK